MKEITGVRFCSQRFVVDSVDGLSYFLLSTGVFYDEYGYDVMLTHDTTNPHRMKMTMPDGTIKLIPLEYCTESRTWIARVCVSKHKGRAEKMVRRILARVDRGEEWRFFSGDYLTPMMKAQFCVK